MRLLIGLLLAGLFIGCNNRTNDKKSPLAINTNQNDAALKDSANFTSIQWLDSLDKNFGKIAEGQKLEVSFSFKNTGDKPLVITRVQPSCGCTIAEQPSEPIAPGGQGTIKASFNSEGRMGVNHKTLSVYANTKLTQVHELHFEVEVEKKKW